MVASRPIRDDDRGPAWGTGSREHRYGMERLRVLTWHVHGSYLLYLVQAPHEFYLPVKPARSNP